MSPAEVVRVLQPLYDLAAVCSWNGPSQDALAELILPRAAEDLTVRELLDLIAEIEA